MINPRAASLAMQDFLQSTAHQFAAEEGRYPNGAEIYVLGLFAEWLDRHYRLEAIESEGSAPAPKKGCVIHTPLNVVINICGAK